MSFTAKVPNDKFGLGSPELIMCVPWPEHFNTAYQQFANGGFGRLGGGPVAVPYGGVSPLGGLGGLGGFGASGGLGGYPGGLGGFGGYPGGLGGIQGVPIGFGVTDS